MLAKLAPALLAFAPLAAHGQAVCVICPDPVVVHGEGRPSAEIIVDDVGATITFRQGDQAVGVAALRPDGVHLEVGGDRLSAWVDQGVVTFDVSHDVAHRRSAWHLSLHGETIVSLTDGAAGLTAGYSIYGHSPYNDGLKRGNPQGYSPHNDGLKRGADPHAHSPYNDGLKRGAAGRVTFSIAGWHGAIDGEGRLTMSGAGGVVDWAGSLGFRPGGGEELERFAAVDLSASGAGDDAQLVVTDPAGLLDISVDGLPFGG